MDLGAVRAALVGAGFEVYQTRGSELHLAERVRMHLMDAYVRVRVEPEGRVLFVARAQQSDFPADPDDRLFERVRVAIGTRAQSRGYTEALRARVPVVDPVDDARVLDVWYEVSYEKPAPRLEDLLDEVRWALGLEKYVAR